MTLTQGQAPVTVDYNYNGVTYIEVIGIVGSTCPYNCKYSAGPIATLNIGANIITIDAITDNGFPVNAYLSLIQI